MSISRFITKLNMLFLHALQLARSLLPTTAWLAAAKLPIADFKADLKSLRSIRAKDSNVSISLAGELRQLEYSQRLHPAEFLTVASNHDVSG
ncbi:hypothetical protein [Rhizobium sp. SYY.PMSO]|uniref:hypothetical protein n=1 Tax=Rhizobium sp. SYY.PMSO TaxID=3382192 RepID=UPI00398FD0DD